jgi:hypothetical protein
MSLAVSLILIAIVAISGVYVSWRAGRLDRLHTRVETARASLDAALVRRSSVTLEIAYSGLLDPAASVLLADLAHDARSAQSGRELAESDLTRALRTVFSGPDVRESLGPGPLEPRQDGPGQFEPGQFEPGQFEPGQFEPGQFEPGQFEPAQFEAKPGADELIGELESTAHQVFIARKFYNDAVAVTMAARRRPLARMLRLAGGAPMPEFFEIDDTLAPTGMGEQGTDMPHLAG